eukprot:COSAG06_NODE_10659_length_1640_cov_2.517197_2_plen_96_part_00
MCMRKSISLQNDLRVKRHLSRVRIFRNYVWVYIDKSMRVWVVTWQSSVIGCYSSAVDAAIVGRALKANGCHGSMTTEVRLNAETENGSAILSSAA